MIRGRGKENKSRGVTVKKTATAMVIGVYDEGVQPADCNQVCSAATRRGRAGTRLAVVRTVGRVPRSHQSPIKS